MRYLTRLACILITAFFGGTAIAQVQIPTLGDRISGLISLDDEYKLGREFLRSVRRSSQTINDPLLNDYLVNMTHNLALHSELKDYRLSFIIVDSPILNAFAAPGGIIGVNGGLFLNAHTEGEFASVMAHELAHVSQRHFARSVEDAQRRRIPELATLLASIVIMGTSSPETGQAAIMAAQGRSIENQLRFSRNNEAEADRIGIRTLYDAGYDPHEMPAMFERLMGLNRFGRRPPEFLLSHPVTESRVADTRGRAARYPARPNNPSLEYQLMRARVQVYYEPNAQTAITQFESALESANDDVSRKAASYGLALAHMKNKDFNKAHEYLDALLVSEPNRIAYVVTKGEIYTQGNEAGMARDYLRRHLTINPDNHSLTMAYANALIAGREHAEAARVLERHTVLRPEDHDLWYILAETQGLVGDVSKVHQARAEYFVLVGDFRSASEQLSYALRIESAKQNNGPLLARLRQRSQDVESMGRASRSF
ncbi:MAG: M48 family metalloprotease [Gammaproteobacteria bacterium]|nr:M48 family metalloprotease [Gammaproteobacteria bacterium]MDP2346787.1 M48 family metalloprotease [Gammaproteobacteria bacterium]